MSEALSLKEALARRDAIPAADSARSGSPIRLRLKRTGEIARPIDLARLLTRHGLSLKRAHATLNRIAADEAVVVRLWSEAPDELPGQFGALGVEASPLTIPEVDTRAIRARLGLSQADFAVRFGFELDTVQNWDQGRHAPDPATRVLLAIIDRDPALVEAVMIDTGTHERTPA
ncbi:hypothetical protein SAMN04488125_115103 [Methylorubrum salsuginis]|uniref:Transcriptional regulator n=1 Tax=Methylorubrum salsuginis TaxID=414703 RepID=A0A1I4HVZ0_9HYPH|nr:hypothetical protein SAMN04488125_115103 [Methylorubrum salsuginis]